MGAEESRLDPGQVPGFNPDVEGLIRRRNAEAKKRQENISKQTDDGVRCAILRELNDTFFRHVDIGDHIRPIFDEPVKREKEELDDGIEGTVDLSKLLDELGVKKKEDGSDSDGDLMDFPDYGDSDGTDTDDDDDDDDRGMFHHEVKEEEKAAVSVFSGEAHPISVKGDFCVAETLRCKDMSEWAVQFPIYRFQWFLGTEIGTQVSFRVIPDGEGATFEIKAEAVGRYIQVAATRRVEDQIRDTYEDDVDGGVYDPHIQKARHTGHGNERKFTDVVSNCVVGPILITDGWSYAIMRALADGEFSAAVKLRDELLESDEHEYVKGEVLSKVYAAMVVNTACIEFTYAVTKANRRSVGTSSLFSLEWLVKLFGRGEDDESIEEKAKKLKGEVTAKLKIKSVAFRPTSSKHSIILATAPRKKGFSHTKVLQDLIRFDVDPKIGRDVLLYILLGFQAAVKFKVDSKEIWTQAFERGEVDQGKDLIQRYIEEMTSSVEGTAPAYEEMPLTPWEY